MKNSLIALASVLLLGLNHAAAQEPSASKSAGPPSYCSPCLYYGGNFDPAHPDVGVFPNENTVYIPDATVYIAFGIPRGQMWEITGLFTNNVSNDGGILDPVQAAWSITSQTAWGYQGTVIASGISSAWIKPTGRRIHDFVEYNVGVHIPPLRLGWGEYFLTVVPQCTNSDDQACTKAEFDLDATSGLDAYGPAEPPDAEIFYSNYLGFYYYPLCRIYNGCKYMSAGVIGTLQRQ